MSAFRDEEILKVARRAYVAGRVGFTTVFSAASRALTERAMAALHTVADGRTFPMSIYVVPLEPFAQAGLVPPTLAGKQVRNVIVVPERATWITLLHELIHVVREYPREVPAQIAEELHVEAEAAVLQDGAPYGATDEYCAEMWGAPFDAGWHALHDQVRAYLRAHRPDEDDECEKLVPCDEQDDEGAPGENDGAGGDMQQKDSETGADSSKQDEQNAPNNKDDAKDAPEESADKKNAPSISGAQAVKEAGAVLSATAQKALSGTCKADPRLEELVLRIRDTIAAELEQPRVPADAVNNFERPVARLISEIRRALNGPGRYATRTYQRPPRWRAASKDLLLPRTEVVRGELLVLLDASGSMDAYVPTIAAALPRVAASWTVRWVVADMQLRYDGPDARRAADAALNAGGGTAIFDVFEEVMRQRPARADALVVVSDFDTRELYRELSPAAVLERVKRKARTPFAVAVCVPDCELHPKVAREAGWKYVPARDWYGGR